MDGNFLHHATQQVFFSTLNSLLFFLSLIFIITEVTTHSAVDHSVSVVQLSTDVTHAVARSFIKPWNYLRRKDLLQQSY